MSSNKEQLLIQETKKPKVTDGNLNKNAKRNRGNQRNNKTKNKKKMINKNKKEEKKKKKKKSDEGEKGIRKSRKHKKKRKNNNDLNFHTPLKKRKTSTQLTLCQARQLTSGLMEFLRNISVIDDNKEELEQCIVYASKNSMFLKHTLSKWSTCLINIQNKNTSVVDSLEEIINEEEEIKEDNNNEDNNDNNDEKDDDNEEETETDDNENIANKEDKKLQH